MDSKLSGLPLSAAPQGRTPSKVSLSTSSGSSSFIIRAPPTVDSDVESSNGQENFNYTSSSYDSDTGFESEGFLSGEDGFETASERPFVADPDDENLQEANVVEDSVVSRPNFTDPYGKFGEKDVLGNESAVSGPPNGRIGENSVSNEKSNVSRPIVPVLGTLMTPTDEEGEYGSSSEPEIVDIGIPAIRAHVSIDTDDDFEGIEEVEEDELAGAVRARVKVLRVEDEDEDVEQEFESLVEDNTILVNDSVNDASDKFVEEERIDDSEVSKAESYLASEDGVILGNPEINNELVYSVEEVPSEDGFIRGNSGNDKLMHPVEEIRTLESTGQGESELLEQSLAKETNDTNTMELEGSVVAKPIVDDSFSDVLIKDKGSDDSEEAKFDSSMGIKDGGFSENVEANEDFAYSVGEIQRLEIMEQQESEAKDDPSKYLTEGIFLKESEATYDGEGDVEVVSEFAGAEVLTGSKPSGLGSDVSSSIHNETLESELLEASAFPSVTIEATTKDVQFDVAEVGNSINGGKDDQNCKNKDVNVNGIGSHGRDSDTEVLEGNSGTLQPVVLDPEIDTQVNDEVEYEAGDHPRHSERFSFSDDDSKSPIFRNSDAAKVVMDDPEHSSLSSFEERSEKLFQAAQRRIVGESDEEVHTDEEAEVKDFIGTDVLTALLKAASAAGSSRGNSSEYLSHFTSSGHTDMASGASEENLSEEEKRRLEKLQRIRVKFLRLIHRLGLSPEDSAAAQVLYRLVLAAGRSTTQFFDLESAKRTSLQLEVENKDDLDFSLNILVLGKTGVGKSATINTIFGERRAKIDAFEPATTSVKVIAGAIDGVKVRIFDTPGLRSSQMERAFNRKVLLSVKKVLRKCPPDVVLYVDRLDTQARDLSDLPLLRSITSFLGSSIWGNAIVTLTHAASGPPDGPSGSPLSHDLFVAQRSRIIQQLISQSTGDLRMLNPGLMSPVSLVENHPAKREDRDTWRPELLLLCYSMKILSEANSLERTRDLFDHKKLFGFRSRSAPLLYFLSSLLQPNTHPKLPANQGGDIIDSDNELGDLSDSDPEDDEYDYDQLPLFKPLKRSQIDKLSKEQRKAYFDEYDYRVRLLHKKQIKEELKSLRELKKRGKDGYTEENGDEEGDNPATVAVPLPDMSLPPSFDADNPSHRYRFLEPTSQLAARPVLDAQGWDHDCGYDGVSLETNLAIAGSFPAAAVVQITKDKKDFNVHLDSSVSAKHGESGSTMAGFDVQAVGKQLAYVLKGETQIKTHKSNRTACGASVTFLGESVATGVKIEDRIGLGKRLVLSGSTGLIRCEGDTAYGANFEVRVREKEFPIGQDETTLGVSLMRWRGDFIWGGNLQSQVSVGRSSKMVVRAGLNSKLSGQVSVRTSSSDQLQIALLGILPIANVVFKNFFTGTSKLYRSQ